MFAYEIVFSRDLTKKFSQCMKLFSQVFSQKKFSQLWNWAISQRGKVLTVDDNVPFQLALPSSNLSIRTKQQSCFKSFCTVDENYSLKNYQHARLLDSNNALRTCNRDIWSRNAIADPDNQSSDKINLHFYGLREIGKRPSWIFFKLKIFQVEYFSRRTFAIVARQTKRIQCDCTWADREEISN